MHATSYAYAYCVSWNVKQQQQLFASPNNIVCMKNEEPK